MNKKLITKEKIEIDKIADKIAWFGLPGLVFFGAMTVAPLIMTGAAVGGPVITVALKLIGLGYIFGNPFGMISGIFVLLFLSRNADKITNYGMEKLLILVTNKIMSGKNLSKEQMISKIMKYKISHELKVQIINQIKNV